MRLQYIIRMNRYMKIYLKMFGVFTVAVLFLSCEKFLLEKRTKKILVPSTTQDLQAMMDAGIQMNLGKYCGLIEAGTDDYFLSKGGFDRLGDFDKDVYKWASNPIFMPEYEAKYWLDSYSVIAVANTVLEELPLVNESKGVPKTIIEGTARFHRAFTYLILAQVFSPVYDKTTSKISLGLPMRMTADVNLPSVRVSVEETYNLIEKDIKEAVLLLPMQVEYSTRPNKTAAHALLARFYLMKEEYNLALLEAEKALGQYDKLMDFNKIDKSLPLPFSAMNEETLFFGYSNSTVFLHPNRESYIDTVLYKSYQEWDLRKDLFFREHESGYATFRGSYLGSSTSASFFGLVVPELFLIKAECLTRAGKYKEGMQSLNSLLANRYATISSFEINVHSELEVLNFILEERRKELIFKGVRWSDLRRLNKDPRFAKTLYRKVPSEDKLYELPPNDKRYTYLIPSSVIELNRMPQNPR